MRIEPVEIFDDTTNAAVMRHPGRRFPGFLHQGDSLHQLCAAADRACDGLAAQRDTDGWEELNQLRNTLWDMLNHYKDVLMRHDIPLPFSQDARF